MADGLRIRLAVHNLAANDLTAFRDSYRQMQAIQRQSRLSVSCRTARNAGLLLLASSAERALGTTDAIVSSMAPSLPLHLGDGDARPRARGHTTVVGLDPA